MADKAPFWETKSLTEMSREEWEALCDGCAKCCLEKLEDIDSGEIAHTNVACRLLDIEKCRCSNYPMRKRFVRNCEILNADKIGQLHWMPSTCAYRLINEGKPLPDWHYLVCGDKERVHLEGHSVRGRAIPEDEALDLEDHIVDWPA